MERLLRDAEKMAGFIEGSLDIENFADIADAIHIIQEEMGITGTTALEAGQTISGSISSMTAAWQNLLTGLADGNANIGDLINNLVSTIVGDGTENNLGVIGNILPAVETALSGIVQLIDGVAPKIIEILPGLVERIVPSLISASTDMVNGVISVLPDLLQTIVDALIQNAPALITAAIGLVQSLIQGIQDNYQILVDGAIQIVTQLTTGIIEMLPQIVALGLDLIVSLANGIAQSLPELIPTIIDVILKIVDTLTDPKQLVTLIDSAIQIIMALVEGLVEAIPNLIDAAINIIISFIEFMLDPKNIAMLIEMSFKIVVAIVEGLGKAVVELVKGAGKLISSIIEIFGKTDWKQLGKNIVDGIWNGLKKTWESLKKWFTNAWDGLVSGVKDLLGIRSPSRVFASIGGYMAEGLGEGWEERFKKVKGKIEGEMDFETSSIDFADSGVGRHTSAVYSAISVSDDRPITISVQVPLDGRIIYEKSYQYAKNKGRMYGMA